MAEPINIIISQKQTYVWLTITTQYWLVVSRNIIKVNENKLKFLESNWFCFCLSFLNVFLHSKQNT